MKFHGFIVGVVLAVMAGSAWGTQCFIDIEAGPFTCNCSDLAAEYTTCSNSTVKVTSGHQAGFNWVVPGLTATAAGSFSKEVSTGDSECIKTTLPPGYCAWWTYTFLVCISYEVVEGFWGDKIVQHLDVAYLGKDFNAKVVPGAC